MAKQGFKADTIELTTLDGIIVPELSSTPANPAAGKFKVYIKNGQLYRLDSSGTEVQLIVPADAIKYSLIFGG